MDTTMNTLKDLGLAEKHSRIYLVALENGESTISFLSQKSGIKRTTVYEIVEDLIDEGFLFETQVGKKIFYGAVTPRQILKLKRRALERVEEEINHLEAKHYSSFDIPKIKFHYGSVGFKNIWNEILESTKKDYRIVTNGSIFDGYITNNYLFDEIIKKKKDKGLSSKQLITDSGLAKRIIARDSQDNRITRILPPDTQIEFTEVISDSSVAFISEPVHNFQFIVESKAFAHFRRQMFDVVWDGCK
jgi:sugar-specific transcriptional regulator TrmB